MSEFNTRAAVERHAATAGLTLSDQTIDELATHLEDVLAAAIDEGASPAEARGRALAALEESALTLLPRRRVAHAEFPTGRSLHVLSALRQAIRQFRQHPSFALVTVLVLGLGVGAATTVFTVVDSVVLRPLPYANPEQLVTLWDTNVEKGLAHDPISPVNFLDDRALPVFQDAAAWWRPSVNLVDPGQDPTPFEVIGVVQDVRNAPFGQPVEPAIYFTTRQFAFREQFVAVKAVNRAAAVAAIRSALQQEAPNVPMGVARTWGERFETRTAEPRLLMTLLLFFGGLAALLAALGVYGLFSWSVALRTRELAIRLTLGAKPATVAALVIRQSAALIVVGLAAGIVLIRLAEGVLARVVFGVTTSDAAALVTASGVLLLAALVACVPPALRAMRVDPVEGLRAE